MLEIQNISVKYSKDYILKDLSISIDENDTIIGILGKNGAGKTTLFNTLFGGINFEGTILYKNEKVKKEDIAYLETTNYFYPYIKANEYLNYFLPSNSMEVDYYNSFFKLPLNEYVDSFSTGMKKKLALIGVLLLNKPIIILDEPFNGLDIEGVHVLYKIIKALKAKKKIVFISSHIIETLFNTCDKIAFLENKMIGKVIDRAAFGVSLDLKY